ncbi:MAG: hypothetical protein CME65_00155 [Halobacteriovoraceae bacterium]|nr:hypothetical protein [Halobacteriovoraceae bacterium]|tara:strand:- start:3314 stop:3949 length:636 start_codon:yes stop_codon:yes gene_type:complete
MNIDKEARCRILNTALRLFSRQGYSKTTIRQLAKEASVNIASVNYYFKDKLGLYNACFDVHSSEILAMTTRLEKSPESLQEIYETLKLVIEDAHQLYINNPNLVLLIFSEFKTKIRPDSFLKKSHVFKLFFQLEIYLKKAIEKKILSSSIDSHIIASAFCGSIFQSIIFDENHQQEFGHCIKNNIEYRENFSHQLAYVYTYGMLQRGEENV